MNRANMETLRQPLAKGGDGVIFDMETGVALRDELQEDELSDLLSAQPAKADCGTV